MPLIPISPPTLVQSARGFDYVAIDSRRRRVYAAHTSNSALLVVNADTGSILREIHVGRVQGVAVDSQSGHVYTGDGIDRSISEVDPASGSVLRDVDVDGDVDAIAYDSDLKRIYADEDDGNRIFVINALTMKQIAVITLPGHKPEYLAIEPNTHRIYQNIAGLGAYAVIDPYSLHVTKLINTGSIKNNHPLQVDSITHNIIVGGDGMLARFDANGKELGRLSNVGKIDQCSLNQKDGTLVCAGSGKLSEYDVRSVGSITKLNTTAISTRAHTVAIDSATGKVWTVWGDKSGEYIQGFRR